MLINVIGTPAPQGSKRHVGRGIMIESSAKVKPWREAVKYAAVEAMTINEVMRPAVPGAVHLSVTFLLDRPKSAKNRQFMTTKPDLSKLLRSTEDALTDAGVWEDDSRVVRTDMGKRYVRDVERPGAVIEVRNA